MDRQGTKFKTGIHNVQTLLFQDSGLCTNRKHGGGSQTWLNIRTTWKTFLKIPTPKSYLKQFKSECLGWEKGISIL